VVPLSEGSAEAAGQHGDATTALRNRLASALRSGEVRATALAYEAKVLSPPETFKTDAIGIALQHQDGYSAIYVIPYRLDAGKVTLGKPEVIEQRPARRGM
jgi:hypothetical protein